jgi:hypothetical protein
MPSFISSFFSFDLSSITFVVAVVLVFFFFFSSENDVSSLRFPIRSSGVFARCWYWTVFAPRFLLVADADAVPTTDLAPSLGALLVLVDRLIFYLFSLSLS